MMCAEMGCPHRVIYAATGWAHVDTHGASIDHPAEPTDSMKERHDGQ